MTRTGCSREHGGCFSLLTFSFPVPPCFLGGKTGHFIFLPRSFGFILRFLFPFNHFVFYPWAVASLTFSFS